MNYIIIPDIHHKWKRAEKIIDTLASPDDLIIFLGDYFDDFGDSAKDAKETAEWLKDSLTKSNRIHLYGNHDIPYRWDIDTFWCSGVTAAKDDAISEVLTDDDWDKLVGCYILENNILLTHAGLNRLLDIRPENLAEQLKYAEAAKSMTPLFNAGIVRGGYEPVGGILWNDWWELTPIPGWSQIFGHSKGSDPRVRLTNFDEPEGHVNWCIDTNLNTCAIVSEKGEIDIHDLRGIE